MRGWAFVGASIKNTEFEIEQIPYMQFNNNLELLPSDFTLKVQDSLLRLD